MSLKPLLLLILLVLVGGLLALMIYANWWGQSHCKKAGGNWIFMNGGSHCVDKEFKEIDIYK